MLKIAINFNKPEIIPLQVLVMQPDRIAARSGLVRRRDPVTKLATKGDGPGCGAEWVPEAALHYVVHTELGRSIRAIARDTGCHASTILRRVRRCENRRDDPLVDGAFDRLRTLGALRPIYPANSQDSRTMTATLKAQFSPEKSESLSRSAIRVLRRLAETGAVLAVGKDMDKAVVVRSLPGGKTTQTTVVDREIAELMALNEWIAGGGSGRLSRYSITNLGRAALKRLLTEQADPEGLEEATQPFATQHRDMAVRDDPDGPLSRRVKVNLAESPLTALARRRDKDGTPFLSDDLVAAGERLREDFELSQMGPSITQNWESFLTGPRSARGGGARPLSNPAEAARDRVHAALSELGPGLGDVVLRCCCFLEGIETTERSMGWSARSGKIVLRIALQRLKRHYEERLGKYAPMIG